MSSFASALMCDNANSALSVVVPEFRDEFKKMITDNAKDRYSLGEMIKRGMLIPDGGSPVENVTVIEVRNVSSTFIGPDLIFPLKRLSDEKWYIGSFQK